MVKVLYIDCCIRRQASRTRKLAEAFLEALQAEGGYEIERLSLMDEPLVPLSEGFFAQRERLLAENKRDHARFRYARQFSQADRVVIAAPCWDLSFPALLKIYIENVCVDGITFGADASGVFGLCQAKRLLFLTTRGGDYSDSPLEMGAAFLEAFCDFWGILRFDCVAANRLDLGLEPVADILERAIQEAVELTKDF
jgi:FMN-dependent NADH-azoreductase